MVDSKNSGTGCNHWLQNSASCLGMKQTSSFSDYAAGLEKSVGRCLLVMGFCPSLGLKTAPLNPVTYLGVSLIYCYNHLALPFGKMIETDRLPTLLHAYHNNVGFIETFAVV